MYVMRQLIWAVKLSWQHGYVCGETAYMGSEAQLTTRLCMRKIGDFIGQIATSSSAIADKPPNFCVQLPPGK